MSSMMADLVLYNGKIVTVCPALPETTAVAVSNGRITAAGQDDEIRSLVGAGTKQVDLGGRLVLPGFSDSHFHLYDWALARKRLLLFGCTSLSEFQARLKKETAKFEAGEWVLGEGWNEVAWDEVRLPTRADLDLAAPDNPVILWRYDHHLVVVNTAALERCNVGIDTCSPPGGLIDRDEGGRPTGVLRDRAIQLVTEHIAPPTEDAVQAAILDSIPVLHQLGITAIHDCRGIRGIDGPPAFRAYQQLRAKGQLDLRVWMLIPTERLPQAAALGLRCGFGDDYLRVGHVKVFFDGGQGARTAWMHEPYEGSDEYGLPLHTPEQMTEIVDRAIEAGFPVAVHSIGDRAVGELIRIFKESKPAKLYAPHRIEHVQNIRPEDVALMGRLNLVASVQPIHITDDYPMFELTVGPRGRYGYPFRDLLDAGVPLALGSDCPVADPNPIWGIHAAVTRQRRDNSPANGWYPAQCITVREAVYGYTMGNALACGRQADLGSIEPEKLADLVVLDRDIMSIDPHEIAVAQVDLTIVGGKIVYQR